MKGKFWQENCCGRNSDVMLFVRFLKEHHAYKIFLDNLVIKIDLGQNKRYAVPFGHDRRKLFVYPPRQWINQAFFWSDTTQGHFYWSQLNEIWESVCMTNGIFNKGFAECRYR